MGSLAARRIAESDWTSAFGEPSSSIYFQLAHGGIRPAPQHRSRLALTLAEREEISRGIAAHRSTRLMARLLGHSPSTVSREISRNAAMIDSERRWLTSRPGSGLVVRSVVNWRKIYRYDGQWRESSLNWSPEQIAGWLKRVRPEDGFYHVSHESIYRSLFVQTRGVSCFAIFDRSGRSAALGGLVQMAIDEGKLRILSRSVSGRQRLKIGRSLVIGRAISYPVRRTATLRPWSNVIRVT